MASPYEGAAIAVQGRRSLGPGTSATRSVDAQHRHPTLSVHRRCGVSGCGLLEDVDAAGRAEADHVGQADLGALDLAVAGLAAEVVAHLPDVGDAGGGDRVALRLQAAGHVHRLGAVAPGSAAVE